ncbi:hypothetical protein C9994_05110 [Marivirga lumbricoides]|uniref:PKD domain-containing protein n=1 Tax=Marivirga lumbricoides TaxID=1046115 RepID=A0A2T4DT68_9BACT|nr:hypothetical protein C9994_05110 [Marivirga lumbricoides]
MTPKKGYAGQLVEVKGVGLTGASRIFFGSMEGEITEVSDQLIEAKVPTGATYDNITVLNSSTRLYYSSEHFMLSYGGQQGVASTDFDTQIDGPGGGGLYDVVVSDLDGDGKNDMIGAYTNINGGKIWENQSTPGNIGPSSTIPAGVPFNTLNLTVGDLNGDGKPELVFSEFSDALNEGNRIAIKENMSTPGSITFGSTTTISLTGFSTKRIIIKDIDLDGKPDLVVSDQAHNKISIVKNTSVGGNISFDPNIIELNVGNAQSTAGLDVEDLNGDGKPDIVANQFLTDGGGFYIATNQSTPGNISFNSFNQYNSPGTFVNLKVGDINNDNKPDIVATLFLSSAVAIFLNETSQVGGAPQFGSARNVATDSRPWGLDFGDVDGDGNIDIAVATVGPARTVNILNNDGTGLNFTKVAIPVTYINRNIKIADIDGDSKPDIVLASVDDASNGVFSSKISVLRNNRCIKPIITPEGSVNACVGNPVRLEAQDIPGLTYQWSKDGAVVKSGPDNFIELTNATSSGDYTVSIISDGGSCAEVSETVTVTIVSSGTLPSATLTANDPVCNGGVLTLNVASDVGATSYEWRGPQGYSATGLSVDVTNFNAGKAGRYYLDVYVGSCIIETKSIVVDVISAPSFFLEQSGAGTYCEGDPVSLNVSPNTPGFSYQWYQGTSPISGATGATYAPSGSGEYHVEITDNVNSFCPTIYSDTLEVAFLAAPAANFSLPASACIASAVSFTNQSTVADESLARYSWNFGDGKTSSSQNPTHTYSAAGTFEVTLEVSYDGFATCTSQSSQDITVNGALNVAVEASSTTVCEGESTVLSVDGAFSSYQWSTGETTSEITVDEGGTYSVTVANANGCEGFSEIQIQTFPMPNVSLTPSSATIKSGDTVSIVVSGLVDYEWFAGIETLNETGSQIEFAPPATTTFKVEGIDANGCFGSAEVTVIVEETNIGDRITPMKFFSPNNDAIAQFWKVENIENFTQCGVEIYDQQGNRIYQAKPYNNDWEGTTDNGSPVPDGVYYYVIKCGDSEIAKSGSITLLR